MKLAEAFGLGGYHVDSLDKLEAALKEAADSGKGNLIVCDIDTGEDVFPIVPPGNAMNDQVLSAEIFLKRIYLFCRKV